MTQSLADTSLLHQIHNLLAQNMLFRLQEGDLKANDWTAIGKFLKDNGIDALGTTKTDDESGFQALLEEANKRILAQAL